MKRTRSPLLSPALAPNQNESDHEVLDVGPTAAPVVVNERPPRTLAHAGAYLEGLPRAKRYCVSFMHRDVVTHLAAAQAQGFLISASADGQLKFWARTQSPPTGASSGGGAGLQLASTSFADRAAEKRPLEFVKQFRAHPGTLSAMALSPDGSLLVTTSAADSTAKVFSVDAFDMLGFARLNCPVGRAVVWLREEDTNSYAFAVAHADAAKVSLFRTDALSDPPHVIELPHVAPVVLMQFNAKFNAVVSIDDEGVIEYWRPVRSDEISLANERRPLVASSDIAGLDFDLKSETDLFELAKRRVKATSLAVSANGSSFVCLSTDRLIRVFQFASGKLKRSYDESLSVAASSFSHETIRKERSDYLATGAADRVDPERPPAEAIAEADFNRRMARERQVAADEAGSLGRCNVLFDYSGNFVIYTTVLGIKVVNLKTNKVARILGRHESSERFLTLALFQESASDSSRLTRSNATVLEPLLVSSSFDSQRIYLFTRTEPTESQERDVLNERPMARGLPSGLKTNPSVKAVRPKVLAKSATLHTTAGDITFVTMPQCEKTVENFTVHARNGYFNGVKYACHWCFIPSCLDT
jgi:peptidylprolyl isomerase domain and WD repeat-containing protein 1